MSEKSIRSIEKEIEEEFAMFEDWTDKYQYIIDLGKEINPIPDQYKTDEYKVSGCQSNVWLKADLADGKVVFKADSDAIIVRGLVGLLLRVLSNQSPDDIINAKLSFIDKIGMKTHLSPTRSNGLVSMVKQMKYYAIAFKSKINSAP